MLHEVEQGTAAWHSLRCGRVTASRVKDVMGTKAKREGYLMELVNERLDGLCAEHKVTDAMEWGLLYEGAARDAYRFKCECTVEHPGFYTCDDIPWFGASPDGTINGVKGLEIKCPFNGSNHLRYIEGGDVPKEYLDQVLSGMICTKMKAWDFVSYDPRKPENSQLFIVPCLASDHSEYMAEIKIEVQKFLQEVDVKTQWFKERK